VVATKSFKMLVIGPMNISKMQGHLGAVGQTWWRMFYYVESVFLEDKKSCEEAGYKTMTFKSEDTHGRTIYNLRVERLPIA